MNPNRRARSANTPGADSPAPGLTRRRAAALLGAGAGAAAGLAALPAFAAADQAAAAGKKVLKLAFSAGETSLDPARVVDLYSRNITPHIFEGLYTYDHLARPVKIKPALAAAMPEISTDFRTFTVKIRPGIFFADDPAFKGAKREVTAGDFVYQFKRIVDPINKSPVVAGILETGFVGLKGLREKALKEKKPFDYDTEIPGLRTLDRYTLRIELEEPRPRLIETLAAPDLFPAVAREVVEHYGDQIDAHPVGTGPFRLKQWRRASLIVLEKSPHYRGEKWDAEPAADDAEGQAMLKAFKGRTLPLVDEVHISIIDESQPRWLAFLNTQLDALATQTSPVPGDFITLAMPNGKLAPNLAKRGILSYRSVSSDSAYSFFNMKDPIVGGNEPHKVALRRAISLSYDVDAEIRIIRKGAAIKGQSPIMPHTTGYTASFKSSMNDYDPARAKALLELYGYVDRDGDGFRELPDGKPFTLEMHTQPEQRSRAFDEQWRKSLHAVGIRIKFITQKWPENLKQARAGKLQFWMLGASAASPDGQGALARYFGPQAGSQNMAFFQHPDMDRIYEQMRQIPDGPERDKLFDEAKRLAVAYVPYKIHAHRIETDLLHPWIKGYRRPVFWQDWWQYVDIDLERRAKG